MIHKIHYHENVTQNSSSLVVCQFKEMCVLLCVPGCGAMMSHTHRVFWLYTPGQPGDVMTPSLVVSTLPPHPGNKISSVSHVSNVGQYDAPPSYTPLYAKQQWKTSVDWNRRNLLTVFFFNIQDIANYLPVKKPFLFTTYI